MSRRNDPDLTLLTAAVVTPVVCLSKAVHSRTKEKHAKGEWTLGIPFFILGSWIGYGIGLHDPSNQFVFAVLFAILGAILATILNFRIRKRKKLVKSQKVTS